MMSTSQQARKSIKGQLSHSTMEVQIMAKFKKECSLLEIGRYERVYLTAWDAVSDSIIDAEIRLTDQQLVDAPQRLAIVREITRLKAVRNLLEAKRQGFRANQKAIKPPKKAKVKEAQGLAEKMDLMIKNSESAVQVIAVADQAVTLFNAVQAA
jgi:transcriptional/translational regulatory protein YebC/TACO1